MSGWFFIITLVALLAAILTTTVSTYTSLVDATVLEGAVVSGGSLYRVTKASYVVDGTTYIWNAKPGDDLLIATPVIVGQTKVPLYCERGNPASARPDGQVGMFIFGIIMTVISAILLIVLIVEFARGMWRDYNSNIEQQKQ